MSAKPIHPTLTSFVSGAAMLALAVLGGCTTDTTTDHTSLSSVAPVADSLITNASFENGLTGWTNWWGTTARTSSAQRSGTAGLKLGAAGGAEQQDVTARLQAGVITQVRQCESGWCRVSGNGFDGWIEQQRLWGVYADEKVNWILSPPRKRDPLRRSPWLK